MRILLVEDDSDLSNNICLTLNQAGYQTDQCYTGSEGLYYASNQIYDCLLYTSFSASRDVVFPASIRPC